MRLFLRPRCGWIGLLVLSLVLGQADSATAQTEDRPNLRVLGPQLQSLFPAEGSEKTFGPGEYPGEVAPLHVQMGGEVTSKVTPPTKSRTPQYGVVVYTSQPELLRQAGIGYNSAYSDFVTARLTRGEIVDASYVAGVERIRAAGVAKPHNDVAAGVSGVRALNNGRLNDTEYTGAGTIVCFVGTGIDYTHRDFRGITDDTNSRILFIWDHTLDKEDNEQTPADRGDGDLSGFNYGVEYTRSDIEDEIDGNPAGFVRQEDIDGHGTHVAGTAAGNGGAHPEQKYKGMAPKSDVIFVKAGDHSFPFSNVVDGMNYCGEVAEDESKPVVVNMSLGADSGPHDGTTFQDEAVDNFVSSASGRAVVVSAGNEGNSGMHTTNSLAANSSTTFDINVPSSVSSGEFRADTWISSDDNATIEVETPNGTTVGPLTPADADGELIQSTSDGRVRLLNYIPGSLGDGDRRLFIEVDDEDGTAPAEGTWTVTVDNTSSNGFTHHVWLFDASITSSVSASLVEGDSNYTIGTPGSSKNAITIGSWVHRWRWSSDDGSSISYSGSDRSDNISSFSSIGPLRDGTQKPEIAAPGQGMGSSYSSHMGSVSSEQVLPGGNHRLTQGTSMAAPTTAGSVALLFQEDATLSYDQIKTTLQNTARTDGFTGSTPNDRWGAGKLDALRAMNRIVGPSSMPAANSRREVLAYDDWGSGNSTELAGSEKFAVRFTPSFNGVVTDVLLHPSSTVNLSGPLNVEIWSDDGGGLPHQKLGSTVAWNQDLVFGSTWNALDVTSANVKVEAGRDYHIVLSLSNSGDDISVRYDDGSIDGRSSLFDGTSWGTFGSGDFRMRPVVTTLNRQVTIVGDDGTGNNTGWRLLTVPSDATRGDLEGDLDFNVTSGSLLHTWDGGSSTAWNDATTSSHPLSRGEGFILYFFDDSTDPLTSDGITVDVPNGSEDMTTDKTVSGLTQTHQFHLLGDPFDEAFDLSELKDPEGNTFTSDFQAAVMIWDPATSSWTTVTEDSGTSNDRIASGQGFFVERTSPGSGATSLTFNTAGKLGIGQTADVVGSKREEAQSETRRALVQLDLSVTQGADTGATDGATVLFGEQGAVGWDTYEASQLPPPNSNSYVTLSSPILRDGDLVRRLQASRAYPTTTDTIAVPLSARSVQVSGTARLGWPEDERGAVPDDWAVVLEDTETGTQANLREETYTFDLSAGDGDLSAPDEARFRLHVVPSSAVPVELAGVNARATGDETVRLTWQTASETNNAGFYVQRRDVRGQGRAGEWTRLGFVESKAPGGTTSGSQSYRFTDADLPYAADSLTYRLRQVDTDGTTHFSEAVTVARGAPERLSMQAPFPNPAGRQATVRFAVPESHRDTEVQIAVYDLLGRRVATVVEGRQETGRHEHRLDLGSWAAGPYFLRLEAGEEVRTRKLTVLR